MSKTKVSRFNVTARVVVIAEVPVVADTFEMAVEKAKALKVSDFVTVEGEHMDNSLRLVSIGVPDSWNTD